jgi:hypothetical protein
MVGAIQPMALCYDSWTNQHTLLAFLDCLKIEVNQKKKKRQNVSEDFLTKLEVKKEKGFELLLE